MISPSLSELKKYKKGTITPVFKEIMADLETPVSVFLKLNKEDNPAILLESVELGAQLGRYSFICPSPKKEFVFNQDKSVLETLEKEIEPKRKKFQKSEYLPDFQGGLVGYLSYENVRYFESVSIQNKKPSLPIAESVFYWVDHFILFDHLEKKMRIVQLIECDKNLESNYKKVQVDLNKYHKLLDTKVVVKKRATRPSAFKLKSNLSKQSFTSKVKKIKNYIRQGDCIQVVMSQRFDLGKVQDDFSIYRVLRSLNPSPYMFYFRHNNLKLIGSSPELLVKKTGTTAEVRPIAGTRPRGKTEKEDKKLEQDLKNSKKEMAEHLMLVDLGRNDLGRVSKTNTVEVDDYARVERYSHVMHLVTDVTGTLQSNKTDFDLLKATFPAGTVSGAPKIRAMEIIDELEKDKRGPYAGAVGYFSLTGDMDMCIAIRTVVVDKDHAYVQAGAGIVYDSNPEKEYEETVNKAKALIHAIQISEGNDLL